LNDVIISLLANLIGIFHDKEIKLKPFFTLKFITKTLSKKEVIPSYYKNLGEICEKLTSSSTRDILTLIFNFLIQFQTLTLKNANSIPKNQTKNYDLNIKAILIEELENIPEEYNNLFIFFKTNK